MSQSLFNLPRRKVLEVGTGCGYQTSVLAGLGEEIYTIERVEGLLPGAKERFKALALRNVTTRLGDGYEGWERFAPFDGIIVTAAPPEVPGPLIEQLAEGGRLVMPVGDAQDQRIMTIDRIDGQIHKAVGEPVRFVPMLRGLA